MSGGTVLRAEAIHRRPKAPRTRAVEVRDLNNPHTLNQNRHVCSVNNATPTGRRTVGEQTQKALFMGVAGTFSSFSR